MTWNRIQLAFSARHYYATRAIAYLMPSDAVLKRRQLYPGHTESGLVNMERQTIYRPVDYSGTFKTISSIRFLMVSSLIILYVSIFRLSSNANSCLLERGTGDWKRKTLHNFGVEKK